MFTLFILTYLLVVGNNLYWIYKFSKSPKGINLFLSLGILIVGFIPFLQVITIFFHLMYIDDFDYYDTPEEMKLYYKDLKYIFWFPFYKQVAPILKKVFTFKLKL